MRDVLHVSDAVDAYVAAWRSIDRVRGRAFNLGGGPANAISLLQLIDHVAGVTGRPVDVAHADWRAGDQRYYVSDPSLARRSMQLGKPMAWRRGVADLAAWLVAETPQRTEFAQPALESACPPR